MLFHLLYEYIFTHYAFYVCIFSHYIMHVITISIYLTDYFLICFAGYSSPPNLLMLKYLRLNSWTSSLLSLLRWSHPGLALKIIYWWLTHLYLQLDPLSCSQHSFVQLTTRHLHLYLIHISNLTFPKLELQLWWFILNINFAEPWCPDIWSNSNIILDTSEKVFLNETNI